MSNILFACIVSSSLRRHTNNFENLKYCKLFLMLFRRCLNFVFVSAFYIRLDIVIYVSSEIHTRRCYIAAFLQCHCDTTVCLTAVAEVDDCASSPCTENGTCVDRVLGYFCNCSFGFTGTNCESGTILQRWHYSENRL